MGSGGLTAPSRGWLTAALIGTLTTAALVWSVLRLTPLPVRVDVDLEVSSGGGVNLFVNDLSVPPRMLPVVAGRRHRYVFEGITDDITMLRVDPTDQEGASVDVHAVAVVGADGPLAVFGPADLAGWTTDGVAVIEAAPDRLRLRTTTADPILTAAVRVPLPRPAGSWTAWLGWLRAPDVGWRLIALAFLVGAAIGLLSRPRRSYLVMLAAVSAIVAGAAWLDPGWPQGRASAAVAVSRATYLGWSTLPGTLSTLVVLAGSVLCGGIMSRLRAPVQDAPARPRAPGIRWWLVPAGLAVIVPMTALDLGGWAIGLQQRQFVSHWDANNITYWSYLSHTGHLPLRDYWYPYAGFFLFDLPFPTGPAVRWLFQTALFGVLYASVAMWLGGTAAALAVGLTWMGDRTGIVIGIDRYLLSAVIVLSYVGAWTPGRRPFRAALVPFWCAFTLALAFDPAQVIYAALPLGVVTAGEFVQRRTEWRGLLRGVATDLAVPAVVGLLWLAVNGATGQLPGLLEFYGRLGDAVAYSAYPAGFPELGAAGFPRVLVFIVGAAFALALGTCEALSGDDDQRRYGYGLAGMGLLSLMVLQKHLVRWMDDQLLIFSTLTAVVLMAAWPKRRPPGEYVGLGLMLGVAGAVLALQPEAPGVVENLRRSPTVLQNNVRLLTGPGDLALTVNRARFAHERFSGFLPERRALDVMRAAAGPAGDVRAAALTDEPIVYLLTGQPAVWMSNTYDASPIYRQERVVQWMRRERPPFLVFRRDRLRFDDVPVVVRDPLLAQEAVVSYAPLDTGGDLFVLRRRTPGEPVAWSFWREQLGEAVELGHLAAISSYRPTATCEPSCADLLVVSVPPGTTARITVPLLVGGMPFAVSFDTVSGQQAYQVLLDRLWFWGVGKASGLELAVDTRSAAGATLEWQTTRLADRLY